MKRIFEFLSQLKTNNNREWFQANKPRFDELHKIYADIVSQLIDGISTFDKEITGLDAKNCIFRIYRDVRFSNDKSPYKTHFGAFITATGVRTSSGGGYYFHIEPGNSILCGGSWHPAPHILKQLRKDIYDNIDEFIAIIEDKKFKSLYGSLEGEMLKKIPEGFPKNIPQKHADILKHKNFTLYCDKPDSFFDTENWIEKVVEEFKILYPFNKFLNYTIGEFYRKTI
ncbi:MAG: DUF2461 domain-containing protein [Tannerella sp.]|jgi:uncharacterized protein (TIGR02453 family)|nr:DUF2461 domain-containing protein [Tannerella sp.]